MTTSGVSGQWHPVSADRGAVEVFVRVPPLEQFAIKPEIQGRALDVTRVNELRNSFPPRRLLGINGHQQ
jgi:hypothetical protein